MFAVALTANAHCGTCGTGKAHAVKKACAADCAKACCEEKAECDKDAAKSDKPAKKACSDGCAKACCTKKNAAVAAPATLVATAPVMPCCAKK